MEAVERFKIRTFIDGIRDPETKMAVLASPKAKLAETIDFALTNEAARAMCRPNVKVRRIDTVEEGADNNFTSLCEAIKTVEKQSFNGKCFVCG